MKAGRSLILVAAFALAIGVGLVFRAPALVHSLIVDNLTAKGLGPVTLKVEELGLNKVRITDLSLAGDGAGLREVVLSYSPQSLLRRHLDGVHITGAFLRGRLSDASVDIPVLDVLLSGEEDVGAPAFSVGHVNLESADISLEGEGAALKLNLTGSLNSDGEDAYKLGFGARLTGSLRGGEVDVRSTWHGGLSKSFQNPDLRGRIFLNGSNLQLVEDVKNLSFQGQVDAELRKDAATFALAGPFLVGAQAAMELPGGLKGPYSLLLAQPGRIDVSKDKLEFTVDAGLRAREGGVLYVRAEGSGDFSQITGKAEARIELARLALDGVRVEGVDFFAPVTYLASKDNIQITAADTAKLGIEGLSHASGVVLTKPIAIPLEALLLKKVGDSLTYEVKSATTPFSLDVKGLSIEGLLPAFFIDESVIGATGGRIKTPFAAPISLTFNAKHALEEAPFSGRLTMLADALSLEFQGMAQMKTGEGQALLELPPVAFSPDLLQPSMLSSLVPKELSEVEGVAGLRGGLSWSKKGVDSDLDFLVKDLSFDFDGVKVAKVNSVFKLDGVSPLSSPPRQEIAVGSVLAGLPFANGLFRVQLIDEALLFEGGSVSVAGGEIRLKPARLDFEGGAIALEMELMGLDLADFTSLAAIEGLEAVGVLDGAAPLKVDGAKLKVAKGGLKNRKPGVIRYRPKKTPSALQGGGEGVNLMLKALENFHFDRLEAGLDGVAGEDLELRLHLAGKNPDLYGGHPLEFNLNLSGALDSIVKQTLDTAKVPASVQKRIDEFTERNLKRN